MPQIQVFQCPACGANLSYDGGPEISFACQFCGAAVVVPKEWRPAAATPAAPPSAPRPAAGETEQLSEVVRLARAGQEVEAVRLMRETSPDMSLKEALAAVNQLAGPPPALAADQTAQRAEVLRLVQAGQRVEAIKLLRESGGLGLSEAVRLVDHWASLGAPAAAQPAGGQVSPRAVRKGATTGGAGFTLGCVAPVVVAVVVFILALAYLPLRQSGSYDQAVKAARTNPDVVRAMGAPIVVDWWRPPTGGIRRYSDGSCSADYHISIRGSRKSGELWVLSRSTGSTFFNDGTWMPRYVVTVYNSDVRPIWVGR